MTTTTRSTIAGELLRQVAVSSDVYPQQVDLVRQAVLLVRFDAARRREASFLDDRILGPATPGAWVPIAQLMHALDAAPSAAPSLPLHFIFHSGHVGSTLLSRLLDDVDGVRPLREPLALRNLADAHDTLALPESLIGAPAFRALLAMFVRLWRRGDPGAGRVLLKATSSSGRLAPPLLQAVPGARAVYLSLGAEPYLATLLAGRNSLLDLRWHGPGRMRRLQARLSQPLPPLHGLSAGELAAMSWLAETCSQHDALALAGGAVLALDFEALLADVEGTLRGVLAHFGLPVDAAPALARSPALSRYSKAPEQAYSAAERGQRLAEARLEQRDEIRRGLLWLEARARDDAALAQLIVQRGG